MIRNREVGAFYSLSRVHFCFLSLSPGPADVTKADQYAANANLWRISGDFWDQWPALRRTFALLDRWSPHVKPGGWPDADMLPLGRIGVRAERGDDQPVEPAGCGPQQLAVIAQGQDDQPGAHRPG